MDHWHEVMPNQILDVAYEEQLAPLEARLRDAGLLDLANESSD